LRARGIIDNATIRSPLLDLTPQAEQEIEAALREARII